MSFPRAKIQRFNDVLNNVPSPTKYDPKLGDKVKGGCILKGETRPSNFSDTASASSSKSVTPVFRTPQLPRRHNCLGTAEKVNVNAFKSISFKNDDLDILNSDSEMEELKALRVECANKTETINDLEKYIQELKNKISEQEKNKVKLESYLSEIEKAKSDLECVRDNERCEKIIFLKTQLEALKQKIEQISQSKEEYLLKIKEYEIKNNKLEELNLDFERKIISLEGTIEQLEMEVKNKEGSLSELKKAAETNKMNHKVSVECLQGKISTLENEIKDLELSKNKSEDIIFGLETEISNLNAQIEKLKIEKLEIQNSVSKLEDELIKAKADCKIHNDIIVEMENRLEELQKLQTENAKFLDEIQILNTKVDEQKASFEKHIEQITTQYEKELSEINTKYKNQEELFRDLEKNYNNTAAIAMSHEKEILQLQNDYESKLLAQMQENTERVNALQCQLDEKEQALAQANVKAMNIVAEWETKLRDTEDNFSNLVSRLESEHIEKIEAINGNWVKKLEILETSSLKAMDMKNMEIDTLTQQYKEMLFEVNELLKDIEKKDLEIHKLSGANNSLNSRIKLMLEEIKLLNKENEEKTSNLKAMTTKYSLEFNKNELLSCKLGELDSEIAQLKKDLSKKVDDWKKTLEELSKSRILCDTINNKKLDLETTVAQLQEKLGRLAVELSETNTRHEEEMHRASQELLMAKNQCRKFEIVLENTRKSLEAVRVRLIESENEVEKLNGEKLEFKTNLISLEKKVENYENIKLNLEAALDEYLLNNKRLTEKCTNLETLCEGFDFKVKELSRLSQNLEHEKQKSIQALTDVIKKQELQLIETERDALNQVEKVSELLTQKLDFFMKFSTDKIKTFMMELKNSKKEAEELKNALKSKNDDYDNLVTDCEILKTTVEIAVKESETLKSRCEHQDSEFHKMKENFDELKVEKENLEEMLKEKEKEYLKLKSTCQELTQNVESKIEELGKERENKMELEREVSALKYRLEQKATMVEENEQEVKKLDQKILNLELKLREKETDIASCRGENLICIQEIQQLTAEKEQLMLNIRKAQNHIEVNDRELETLKEQVRKAEYEAQHYKNESFSLTNEVARLQKEVLDLEKLNKTLKGTSVISEDIEERKNYYKENCMKLDKLCSELMKENSSLKKDFNESHALLQLKEKEVEAIEKRRSELESLIGPFREQLEQYENERLLMENDREELRKQHLEQAAKLGHQNHKQKIQHVVKLKNNLLDTRKENEKLNLEVKVLKKKVQKLQEELGQDPKRLFIKGKRPESTPFKGKENSSVLTPSAGGITPLSVTVKQDPVSPGSPLRNRNQ